MTFSKPDDTPPLLEAVMTYDVDKVRELLEAGADPNAQLSDGTNALSWSQHIPEIRALLLSHGARPDTEKPDDGHSCIHTAAENGRIDALTDLLDAGGAVFLGVFDYLENTPLHWAAQNGHLDAVRLLITHGADLNANNEPQIGYTPLDHAVEYDHVAVAEMLLKAGADPNIPTWMQLSACDHVHYEGSEAMRALFARFGY